EIANVSGVPQTEKLELIRRLLSTDIATDKRRGTAAVDALVSLASQGSADARTYLTKLERASIDPLHTAASRGLKRLSAAQNAIQASKDQQEALLHDPNAEICIECLHIGLRPSRSQKVLAVLLRMLWFLVGVPAVLVSVVALLGWRSFI